MLILLWGVYRIIGYDFRAIERCCAGRFDLDLLALLFPLINSSLYSSSFYFLFIWFLFYLRYLTRTPKMDNVFLQN